MQKLLLMSTLHIAYYIGGQLQQCKAIMQIEIPLDFVAGCKSSLGASYQAAPAKSLKALLLVLLKSLYWCLHLCRVESALYILGSASQSCKSRFHSCVAGCKSSLWASWLLLMSILQSTYYIQGGRWCSMQVFIVGQLTGWASISITGRELLQ